MSMARSGRDPHVSRGGEPVGNHNGKETGARGAAHAPRIPATRDTPPEAASPKSVIDPFVLPSILRMPEMPARLRVWGPDRKQPRRHTLWHLVVPVPCSLQSSAPRSVWPVREPRSSTLRAAAHVSSKALRISPPRFPPRRLSLPTPSP